MCAALNESYPISLRLRLDFLDFHSKLHAQTSTLWTLCAALNESYPISLRLRLDFLDFHSNIISFFQQLIQWTIVWQAYLPRKQRFT
ncbi:hypothetical protein SELSPUOL_02620 [Selenomonas sputigena ATCC 35185]|uniref:Uncharacterized protein n=1 Tax=Selenomonas sputigena (strain ATCC 35185 / DSM 20758 / CCUG 44933 / VPI D19B-28) TaxID=546271 RepID=C9LYQ9_SELS3|nr:hypothetical protein SELSPUOL_02620 [Selenomonas sputigena ATCC 35185]